MDKRTFCAILLLTGIFFVNFVARTVPAPLMPTMEAELGLDHMQAGALFLYLSGGYFLALFFSGFLSAVSTHRRVIQVSAAGVGASMILASASRDLWFLRGSFALLGLFAGLYLPSGVSVITGMVEKKRWGLALAVHEAAPNASFVAAPLVVHALLSRVDWPMIFLFVGLFSLFFCLLFSRFTAQGGFPGRAPGMGALKELAKKPGFWVTAGLFSLGITGTLGIFNMLPLYLVADRGVDPAAANLLVSASRVSGLVMALFAGWVVDRVGPGRSMGAVFLLSGGCAFAMGAAKGPLFWAAVFLQPAAAVCFFPAGFVALSGLGGEQERNLAVSAAVPPAFLVGAGLVPVFLGAMAGAGRFSMGMSLVGVFMGLGVLAARKAPNPRAMP
ncbi:MAG: MFS transporter [Deltaproteobacteria bacterium]|nr:MFS transporter [Deltaproteobacteria bacterium]